MQQQRGGECDQDIIWYLQISSSVTLGGIQAIKLEYNPWKYHFFLLKIVKRTLSHENIINFNFKRLSHEAIKSSWEKNGKAKANYIPHGVNTY